MRFENDTRNTWLIQRLKKPLTTNPKAMTADRVFGFGGGHHQGGLSDAAWEICAPIFSWDYMGAAEFEFGAVPKAFMKLIGEKPHEPYCIEVEGYPLKGQQFSTQHDHTKVLKANVYVYASKELRAYSELVVRTLAREKYPKDANLKEYPMLWHSLFDPEYRAGNGTVGWFELDNGFLFFRSKAMWQQFCKAFLDEGQAIPDVPDEIDLELQLIAPAPKKRNRKVMQ